MNVLIGWSVAVAAIALVIFGARGRLSPFLITITSLGLVVPGYASLADSYRQPTPFYEYALGVLTLATGYAWTKRSITSSHEVRAGIEPPRRGGVAAVFIILAILGTYHFAVVGLPILQANVEISRFDFTGSGLFGLPGRVVSFGIPIFTYLAVAYARGTGSSIRRPGAILGAAMLLLFATGLVMGFKSGILDVITILLVAVVLAWGPPKAVRAAVTLAIPIVAAVFFAVMVSGLYGTFVESNQPALAYLVDRSTVIGAIPGYDVLSSRIVLPSGEANSLVNDAEYYVPKYLGLGPPANQFPFELVVSASIFGTSLTDHSFIVPVTVGAFASLLWDFSQLGFLFYVVLGVVFAWAENRAFRETAALPFVAWLTLLTILNGYLTKGDLVFNVLNWGAMLAFVALTYGAACVMIGSRRTRNATGSMFAAR
jgi:hypothetical protein